MLLRDNDLIQFANVLLYEDMEIEDALGNSDLLGEYFDLEGIEGQMRGVGLERCEACERWFPLEELNEGLCDEE